MYIRGAWGSLNLSGLAEIMRQIFLGQANYFEGCFLDMASTDHSRIMAKCRILLSTVDLGGVFL
jgi:hypothetical protein